MNDIGELLALLSAGPEEAVRYFKQKGLQISWNWWDMWKQEHAKAFTVAHLAQADILAEIRQAVQTALEEGKTELWFKEELVSLLKQKGWWGKIADISPKTGLPETFQAGSPWRLETIYRTNLQNAYMAGRWKQFEVERERAPYIQYLAVLDSRTRPAHSALNGKVFRINSPVWDIIAPANGFNCRCRVRNLSERELKARDLQVEEDYHIESMVIKGPDGEPLIQRGVSIPDPKNPGKWVSLWPDTGWDFNPAKAGSERLIELLKAAEAKI